MTRREFLKCSTLATSALAANNTGHTAESSQGFKFSSAAALTAPSAKLPDLNPARWIWYPSGRCLPNTFILFRRTLDLASKPKRATGWIAADSRYLLETNGARVQWGPAPSDPRWAEADPLDLTDTLQAGPNAIGATVLFYGQGDGTSPIGKAGFLFWLELEYSDGKIEKIVSDASWSAHLARAWKPGHYKRWYLRALQEEFDARLYPHGWTKPDFRPDANWLPAMALDGSPNRPAIGTSYSEYQLEIGSPSDAELRPRSIPMLQESLVPVKRLAETSWIEWLRTPEEYFELRAPNACRELRQPAATEAAPGEWQVNFADKPSTQGAVLTFEFEEQIVGWPYFTIDAPAGTTVELIVQEGHQPGGPVLLNTHYDSWARFICREGENRFEAFEYESPRWLQLHIHATQGTVRVRAVGLRRRVFPWPNQPDIQVGEPALQRLVNATINTLHNSAQETLVDGMGRERQQYSGDCGHQTHAIYLAFGEGRLPARYLSTFSQGMTLDGYFLDCWPAYDRLARLMERQLQLTGWGPILDHGIGFNFDCWHHYLYTGDLEALREPYPRLLRFADYLKSIRTKNGLLPVENIGIPSVWIDHQAFQRQRHKQCAFNLYAAAMLEHALAPICAAFGDETRAKAAQKFGCELREASVKAFWDASRRLFINNLPWLKEEKAIRMCDRSLATAILFDQCPNNQSASAAQVLVDCPPELGFSYPANAGWRLWALGKAGRGDRILKDLRERWATLPSVQLNNSLQEDWVAHPDSGSEWSHCPVAPVYILFMSIAGIRPLSPGFKRAEIRPQLADLENLELVAHTAQGPIKLVARGKAPNREVTISVPPTCEAELVAKRENPIDLPQLAGPAPENHIRYRLPKGTEVTIKL